jgi:hypothetical protein
MNLTILTTSIGLAAAAGLALSRGGAGGRGVIAGFVVGAAVAGASVVRQRRVLRATPGRALQTMVEGFLAKLAAVVVAAVALALIPPLRERVEPGSFLLAFGGAVLLVLVPGTFDNARVLGEKRTG